MPSDRLSQIEQALNSLSKHLADKQVALVMVEPGETERIQQQIDYLKQKKIQ